MGGLVPCRPCYWRGDSNWHASVDELTKQAEAGHPISLSPAYHAMLSLLHSGAGGAPLLPAVDARVHPRPSLRLRRAAEPFHRPPTLLEWLVCQRWECLFLRQRPWAA